MNDTILEEKRARFVPLGFQSFYHLDGCDMAGRHCNGTACFVAKHLNPERWEKAERQEPRVYCMGRCYAAPAFADSEEERPRIEVHSRRGIVLERMARGPVRSVQEYESAGGWMGLQEALRHSPEEVAAEIEISGLRGRGGAGFPAGRKWRTAAGLQGPKYIVANGDEGDAGAYIDRFLLEDDPFAVIEGMAIAAHAIGARRGWIYLRAEYPQARPILESTLAQARTSNVLGEEILGSSLRFDIELFTGKGSYICGEETAMIRSIEGFRPEVMARPPFPAERGLFGRPTLVHNVETLAAVPWIATNGGYAYRSLGFSKSRGTKVVSLNSVFKRPGLYEVEFGEPLRRIVEELGGGPRDGGRLKGIIPGGPLAGIIPPHLLDIPYGFEELREAGGSVGHGGMIGFDEHTPIAELMHHVFSFAAYESCGKCTPCRAGSRQIEEFLARLLKEGAANYWDELDCEQIVTALKMTSLCGHGSGLGEFAESVRRHFGKELEACFR